MAGVGASGTVDCVMSMNRRLRRTLLAGALVAVGPPVVALAPQAPAVASTPTTTPPAPAPSLPEPDDADADPVRNLLPSIVAVSELPATPEASQAVIDTALSEGRHDIAVTDRPSTLCAVVPVIAAVTAAGRWERDGEEIASSAEQRRDPPGYGECLPGDGDGQVPEGVYQYVAVGPTGAMSAAATLVVGTAEANLWLLNNGDEPVCLVLLSPREADFYDAFDTETPLSPGEVMSVNVAATELDARVHECTEEGLAGDSLRSFRFMPGDAFYVLLFAVEESVGSDPTAPTTNPP
jgi:hypothetical protein